jgi:hypothetical protein
VKKTALIAQIDTNETEGYYYIPNKENSILRNLSPINHITY